MDHNEIRFKFLHTLYQKHYSPELLQPQNTENIIQESGLGDVDKNQVAGDIVYLEEKHLIEGTPLIGHKYSPNVRITVYGIDFVQKVFDRVNRDLESENIDNESKTKIRELLQEGESTPTKIQKFVDFAQKSTALWLNTMQIVGFLFGNR
jgi:hypothetical protein